MFISHRFASTQIQPTVDHKYSIRIEKKSKYKQMHTFQNHVVQGTTGRNHITVDQIRWEA